MKPNFKVFLTRPNMKLIEKLLWYLMQLLPLRYVSEYTVMVSPDEQYRELCVWRMWFGKSFNIRQYKLADLSQ